MNPAREAAFKVLVRVEREAAYAVELLHSSQLNRLSPVDRNLAQEIVLGVLRWRSLLDSSFQPYLSIPLKKLDLEVLTALRVGAYQLVFLDRIPAHAIVNESVELVKKARKRSAAGLVNAVMRKLQHNRRNLLPKSKANSLAHDCAHPEWLVERWVQQFGREKAEKICEYDQRVPETVIRLGAESDEEELRAEGIRLAPGKLMKAARVVTGGDVTGSKLFRSGRIAIQDEGSQLVAALVGKGKRILDCCAAPGLKTGALATAVPEAEIYAAELHPHRARLLRALAPQKNVHVLTADARQLPFTAEFDRVLADVPCSGTGTLARNPEIKWRLKTEDIADLQARQIAILSAALKHVAPGGRLVYATCSLEEEENQRVVEAVLKNNPQFEIVPVSEVLRELKESGVVVWEEVQELVQGDFLRTIPGVQPCDGFFGAVLICGPGT
jgi:16S rRNA (cytosine967-C5)-methyltransferase